jgi:hypothetical protein
MVPGARSSADAAPEMSVKTSDDISRRSAVERCIVICMMIFSVPQNVSQNVKKNRQRKAAGEMSQGDE